MAHTVVTQFVGQLVDQLSAESKRMRLNLSSSTLFRLFSGPLKPAAPNLFREEQIQNGGPSPSVAFLSLVREQKCVPPGRCRRSQPVLLFNAAMHMIEARATESLYKQQLS